MKNEINLLLTLQNQEFDLEKLNKNIASIQNDINLINSDISNRHNQLKDCLSSLKEMEIKRNDMRLQRRSIEEKIQKYKIQQSAVKKNEEFKALSLQIQNANKEVSKNEELELELMFKIDVAKEDVAKNQDTIQSFIKELEDKIKILQEKLNSLNDDKNAKLEQIQMQKEQLPQNFLKAYEYAKQRAKRLPFICEVIESKCTGCYIKTSGAILQDVKDGQKIVHCYQCGRILYIKK